jgi:L-threonylcarbamoyladenylate synthase
LLARHYSPKARLIVANWASVEEAKRIARDPGATYVIAHHRIPVDAGFAGVSVIPEDAEAYARALYAELHRCDEAGVELILVEAPPDGPAWEGIRDRLRRASHVAGT